jgi:hypothetical protein
VGVSGPLGLIKLVQYVAMFCLGVCMFPVVCCAVCACIGVDFLGW